MYSIVFFFGVAYLPIMKAYGGRPPPHEEPRGRVARLETMRIGSRAERRIAVAEERSGARRPVAEERFQ